MTLTAIAAMSVNRVIGVNNDLPWNIPEDLKFFRDRTKGAVLLMGRKTFESIKKPLPGRYHIVITRNADYIYEHPLVRVVKSLEEAIKAAAEVQAQEPGKYPDEVFVVGGGEIYKMAIPYLDRIDLTVIGKEYQGDARFPDFEEDGWKLVSENDRLDQDPPYRFTTWKRA